MKLLRDILLIGLPALLSVSAASAVDIVSADQVIPILQRRCIICHGGEYQEGGLDLRTVKSIRAGGKSGSAVKVGQADDSLLIKKLVGDEMPPEKDRGRAGIEVVPVEEIETLKQWIAGGAIGGSAEAGTKIVDSDHWSLQPVRRPPVPAVQNRDRVANPIDAFVLRKLETAGLDLSPAAKPATLLRRLSLGVTGLPARPVDVTAFGKGEIAYGDMVDRMLASQRYGERWGRFWLDLAGYADSEGKRQADMIRKFAWKYRDYVIRSFNADKPYDRFLMEQIAGDELADYSDRDGIREEIYDNLVATGFLRMAPDGTTANPVNRVRDRIDVIADELDILARGVMGLTMDCARCHDHKYDPLSQRDYYRLAAIFKGAYDEYDWMTPQAFSNQWEKMKYRHLAASLPRERARWAVQIAKHEARVAELEKRVKAATAAKDPKLRTIRKELTTVKAKPPAEPMIRALWDRGRPSETFVYRRGDHLLADERVGPGVPAAFGTRIPFAVEKPWAGARPTGRRLAFAGWLTDRRNPLTARVIVNRIWKHHFGVGLVKSLDNFGKTGTPPTHPELLDWLAAEFMDQGWSIKHLHRLILDSHTWRQASTVTAEHRAKDPENRLLSRMRMLRLDAEQVHDSLLAVAGVLNEVPFGEPDPVTVRADGLVTADAKDGRWRRSIYVRQRRKEMPTMLETFDLPQMNPNCLERTASTVVTQPLHLLNNAAVHGLAGSFAERVEREGGAETEGRVRHAYLVAANRQPSAEELTTSRAALASLLRYRKSGEPASDKKRSPDLLALTDYCHTLLNSAVFLYID